MPVSREQLYEEVWAEPMTTVAARYGVSSSFLARVCKHLRVPCPPRGYWARIQAGQRIDRPPLPEAQPGDEEQAFFRGRVEKAREMLGGTDVLRYFRAWKAPEDRWMRHRSAGCARTYVVPTKRKRAVSLFG